jgi:hypothetical protein
MPGRTYDAPPRYIRPVVGHDLADGPRGTRAERGRDVAVGHGATLGDALNDLEHARDEVFGWPGHLEVERPDVLAVLGLADDAEADTEEEVFWPLFAGFPDDGELSEAA